MESKLEKLAKEWFRLYYIRETGQEPPKYGWQRLDIKRRLAWMREVLLVSNHFMKILLDDVKPLNKQAHKTVYAKGFMDGRHTERISFVNLVHTIYEDLNDDYEDFKSNHGE